MKSPSSPSRQLFPFPLINHNVEGLNARHYRRTGLIYRSVVLVLLGLFISLPLIYVDVSSRSRGMLRPTRELNQVTTAIGGLVTAHHIRENDFVCAGDTLLTISEQELDAKRSLLAAKSKENDRFIGDLNQLLDQGDAPDTYPALRSAYYQRAYGQFRQAVDQAQLQLAHAERQLARNEQLLAAGSISRAEWEESTYEREMARAGLDKTLERQRQLWSQERLRYLRENQELAGEGRELTARSRHFFLTAPIDGLVTQSTGLQTGNYVTAGQPVATISPDDDLRVEVLVAPHDIGLIHLGMPVKFQLDAFHPNRWGMATGRVTEIGGDIVETGESAGFLIKCSIDQNSLRLKSGFTGHFKSGMSLTAHFLLARRNLFSLLHDQLDDWLNPNQLAVVNP